MRRGGKHFDTAPYRPGVDGEALVLLDADVVARRRRADEVRHGLVVVVADRHLARLRRLKEHLHALLEAVELGDDLLGLGLVVALGRFHLPTQRRHRVAATAREG